MSLLTAFVAAASKQAGAVIGVEPLTVGNGPAVDAVLGTVDNSRDFTAIGHDPDQSLSAVIRRSDWLVSYAAAGSQYVGKSATARGLTFRVESCHVGQAFVTLQLADTGKA